MNSAQITWATLNHMMNVVHLKDAIFFIIVFPLSFELNIKVMPKIDLRDIRWTSELRTLKLNLKFEHEINPK